MKNIAIFGGGGFGREVKTIIDAINKQIPNTYNFIGFYDDGIEKGSVVNGFPVLGGVDDLNKIISNLELVIALGDSKVKKKIIEKIEMSKLLMEVGRIRIFHKFRMFNTKYNYLFTSLLYALSDFINIYSK